MTQAEAGLRRIAKRLACSPRCLLAFEASSPRVNKLLACGFCGARRAHQDYQTHEHNLLSLLLSTGCRSQRTWRALCSCAAVVGRCAARGQPQSQPPDLKVFESLHLSTTTFRCLLSPHSSCASSRLLATANHSFSRPAERAHGNLLMRIAVRVPDIAIA